VDTAGGPRNIPAAGGGWKTNRRKRKGQAKCRLKQVFSGRWERAMPCQENFPSTIG